MLLHRLHRGLLQCLQVEVVAKVIIKFVVHVFQIVGLRLPHTSHCWQGWKSFCCFIVGRWLARQVHAIENVVVKVVEYTIVEIFELVLICCLAHELLSNDGPRDFSSRVLRAICPSTFEPIHIVHHFHGTRSCNFSPNPRLWPVIR